MRKKGTYVIEAYCVRCAQDDRAVPATVSWNGRFYCAKHDPSPTPREKAKKSALRSPAKRAKNTEAQRRRREKLKKENAELKALHESKRTST